jgi:hypothetical protein
MAHGLYYSGSSNWLNWGFTTAIIFLFFFHSRYVVNLKRLCTLSQTSEQPALQSAKITEKKKKRLCILCLLLLYERLP